MKGKLKKYTKTIIIISSLMSICLVLFIAFSANYYITRMSQNNTELYSAYRISELMKAFKNNINVLENKQRGYMVTGDAKFLDAYKLKESETKTYLKSMEKYFLGKPEETSFYKLKKLTYLKITEAKDLNSVITNALAPSKPNAIQEISVNTMAEIIKTIDEIDESLSKTTTTLLDNSIDYVKASKTWSFLEITLGIITAIAAVIILIADINTRNKLEDELRIAKKIADENTIAKEQFMANMSHEIRTPMNAILGFSDLLAKTKLNAQQEDYLLAVKKSGSSLLTIVNDVLDFSKIEAGKLNIEIISFNIIELLNSLKTMFAYNADEKKINFAITIDAKTPTHVFGDPTRLTQILINLINNAIKFTQQGEVLLSCNITTIKNNVAHFNFKIKDSGIGISPDKINTIFERFNQGNAETTRKYGGNGLGLAIVKQLVEIQNGTIALKSMEGIGSEFSVTINYALSFQNKNNVTAVPQQQLKIASHKPLKILLVEDHPLNQKLATAYLIGFGIDVDLAENGAIALEKVKQTTYDLILMDIQMPILDGYQAAKQICENYNNSIPIIAMTANTTASEKEKCLSCGMIDYLSKPFIEIDLYDIISLHLKPKTENIKLNTCTSINNLQHTLNVVDKEYLNTLSRGNTIFKKEIVEIFLAQNVTELTELNNAINTSNYDVIKSISHKIKTSVGFIGMHQLINPLNEIELLASNNGDLKNIAILFNTINKTCVCATAELNAMLKEF